MRPSRLETARSYGLGNRLHNVELDYKREEDNILVMLIHGHMAQEFGRLDKELEITHHALFLPTHRKE